MQRMYIAHKRDGAMDGRIAHSVIIYYISHRITVYSTEHKIEEMYVCVCVLERRIRRTILAMRWCGLVLPSV